MSDHQIRVTTDLVSVGRIAIKKQYIVCGRSYFPIRGLPFQASFTFYSRQVLPFVIRAGRRLYHSTLDREHSCPTSNGPPVLISKTVTHSETRTPSSTVQVAMH